MSRKLFAQEELLKTPTILIAGRLALLALALSTASFLNFFSYNNVPYIAFASLAGLFAVNLGLLLWFKTRPGSKYLIKSQAILDLCIITSVIYVSGGLSSPYIFLYLPFIFLVRIFTDLKTSLMTSLIAVSSYILAAYFSWSENQQSFAELLITQISILSAAICMLLIGTEQLINLIIKKDQQLNESKADLELQNENQITLITKLPQAVIGFDSNLKITSTNKRAQELFGLPDEKLSGLDLSYTLTNKFAEQLKLCLAKDGNVKFEKNPESISCDFLTVGADKNKKMFLIFEPVETAAQEIALSSQQLEEKLRSLLSGNQTIESFSSDSKYTFIAESKVMKKVFSLIERASPSEATVLINGESGTGKELVARALHDKSPRKNAAFVSVNCGAIPETLLESTFFGHKKGAFTGAVNDSPGLFREANGGSLFLDEIGELPLHMQSKLLRAIQEKKVRPVGADRDYDIDLKIIAATNKNLKECVANGQFRDDLYYRLNVINIVLPALRERKEDLPILIFSFLKKIAARTKIAYNLNISSDALQLLLTYTYPGNVRELENILERAFVLGTGTILAENLQDLIPKSSSLPSAKKTETQIIYKDLELPLNLDQILETLEKRCILMALERTDGHRTKAAELLGINLRSFRYRAQKLGIREN